MLSAIRRAWSRKKTLAMVAQCAQHAVAPGCPPSDVSLESVRPRADEPVPELMSTQEVLPLPDMGNGEPIPPETAQWTG